MQKGGLEFGFSKIINGEILYSVPAIIEPLEVKYCFQRIFLGHCMVGIDFECLL